MRQIAKRLGVGRNTVRSIIAAQGATPQIIRANKVRIDEELLRRLYLECGGWMQRVHEKLVEEEKIRVKYSTLTRMLRELGISTPSIMRCEHVPDEPGGEMQHDTSPYDVALGGKKTRVIASLLYLRYSKRRYLRFYRTFNRFKMKCFFHEALMFWGYSAKQCIIDNTNLARLRGIGRSAVIVPEMESFGRQYGFEFHCHERGHANRKAGEERSFWTVETNFLPGRTFESLEDMNTQALEWATVRMHNRAQGKAGLIPAKAFEYERGYLRQLPPHIPAPYQTHARSTDQYGYIAFDANYYWVPGERRDEVKVLQYSDSLKLHQARECVAEYVLPADGVRNKTFSPEGQPKPCYKPKHRKKPTQEEEKQLRSIDSIGAYLDFSLNGKEGACRHEFIRKLLGLSRTMTQGLFIKSISRAHKYRITSIDIIERIALLYLKSDGAEVITSSVEIDEAYQEREAYKEGFLTEQPDLSIYDEEQTVEEEADG